MYESNRKGLTYPTNGVRVMSTNVENSPLETHTDAYSEIADIFPALKKYKDEHNAANLKKLCVEISEFCYSVYASTENETERKVYRAMIQKLNT